MLTAQQLFAAQKEQARFNELFLQALTLELVEDGEDIELEDLEELLQGFFETQS